MERSDADWLGSSGRLSEENQRLVAWIASGKPVSLRIGGGSGHQYGFRAARVTAEGFRISAGVETELPADYRVFSGRELLPGGGLGETASLAVVNGALALAVTRDDGNYLVQTDPDSGELFAQRLHGFDGHHSCGTSADGRLASLNAPCGAPDQEAVRLPVSLVYPAAAEAGNADQPLLGEAIADHPYFRLGPQYNASVPDILILWASSKSQTGPSSGLSARAASYFSMIARAADVYERQLGLRYLVQEMILVPSDSSDADPGAPSSTAQTADLDHYRAWLQTYRPQATYKWGHAALWTLVAGGSGGVVGQSWIDAYGQADWAQSVQEPDFGWEVHTHEFGHNVGAAHTSGGVMNGSLLSGNEDFFTYVSGAGYTAAQDIFNYMNSGQGGYIFGYAPMRNPSEIPFGVDDTVATAAGAAVSFDPLANDKTQVPGGAANALRLVEVGQVFPRAAGTAELTGGQIRFTPAPGFTGQAWFSYTLGGSVGNWGKGWLHSADVVVTVGGNSTAPSQSPNLSLAEDALVSDLTAQIRINPLLNDEGRGRLWSGDVQVMAGPADTTPESYSEKAFRLASARVLKGTGSLTLEKRYMTRAGAAGQDNTGNISYYPGANEGSEVVIEYTVVDGNGATATSQVVIRRTPSVSVTSSTTSIVEDSGQAIVFQFQRGGAYDPAAAETVTFSVSGTASAAGLRADYALAGVESFDPASGTGTVVIPSGEAAAPVYVAVLSDGTSEGVETLNLTVTGSSSLPVSTGDKSVVVLVSDSSVLSDQSFDGFTSDSATWAGWTNLKNNKPNGTGGEDWFDWSAASGSPPTAGTGPSGDHTAGSGKYMLAEATGNTGKFAYLMGPSISVSGKTGIDLEFWYHMYGAGMGSLTLDLFVNGTLAKAALWTKSGQQSTGRADWRRAVIDVSPYLPATSMQLRFRADIGATELSDIAIDDVRFVARSTASPSQPLVLVDPVGRSVEAGRSVYLSVIPEGFPAPQIQWRKNGVPIAGATGPSFFISALDESSIGTYSADVSNAVGSTASDPAEITIPSTPPLAAYISWVSSQGIPFGKAGQDQDPDSDGLANIFEFAFGRPAMVPDARGLPAVSYHRSGGQTYLQLEYRRRLGGTAVNTVDYSADGITYRVETSTSLAEGTWVSGPSAVELVGTPVANGDGTQTVTVRRRAPIGNGAAFMRVSVTAN